MGRLPLKKVRSSSNPSVTKKVAAELRIKDADKMTDQGVKNIVKWLRYQAMYFKKHHEFYAPRFRARYHYK